MDPLEQAEGIAFALITVEHGPETYAEQARAGNWPIWRVARTAALNALASRPSPVGRDEVLEEAALLLECAIANGYDVPTNKVDQCEHGKFGWEDCIACYDKALTGTVAHIRALKSQPSSTGGDA